MKFLITGVSGQLGYDIKKELISRYKDEAIIIAPNHDMLDITDQVSTVDLIKTLNPDVIFHCAAYTNVDHAEEDCKACYDVNVKGTKNICEAAKLIGAKIIYVSTDYVFDGTKNNGLYSVEDQTNPINFYGKTKLMGEEIVKEYPKSFIARTSWVFGINGKNFVKTMLRLAESKKSLNVVADQFGSPTYTVDLAKLLVDMSETDKYGIYHTNNEGYTSWYDFARYIFESNGIDMEVNPVSTENYKTIAKRPLNSRLDRSNLDASGFDRLPHWKNAVERYNEELRLTNEKVKKLEKREN